MLPNLQKHNKKVVALHQRHLLQERRVIVLKKRKKSSDTGTRRFRSPANTLHSAPPPYKHSAQGDSIVLRAPEAPV